MATPQTAGLPTGVPANAGARTAAPTRQGRLVAAIIVGLAVAGHVLLHQHVSPRWLGDIAQSWAGARGIVRGQNPYAAVGLTGTLLRWPWPLYYPVPALLLTFPFTPLPLDVFRPVFLGGSSAWLAYVVTRRNYWRLLLFTSAAFLGSIAVGAWEPLLVAAALTPGAAALYLAKPNIGVALASALPFRRATIIGIAIAAALLVVSLAVEPGWVGQWHHALSSGDNHLSDPLTRPGGVLVLAALVKWRRAEARFLVMLAAVPQTMIIQATLPLFLVARSRAEMILLALLSYIPFAVQLSTAAQPIPFRVLTERTGTAIALCLYVPCVAMLWRRPNVWSSLDDSRLALPLVCEPLA